jgi:uncharacterized damage-inducible protein DinB
MRYGDRMTTSLLADAFAHHVWATLTLLETCAGLTAEQLETDVPGTFGPIIGTLRHLVSADRSYLELLSGGAVAPLQDEDSLDLAALRAVMEEDGRTWPAVLAAEPDPDAILVRHRPDGTESHAPVGIRLAQVIHHGTDHRSQVCTALTTLGVTPPEIDAWDYAAKDGRLKDTADQT